MADQIARRPKFSAVMEQDKYKRLINNTLQDPKRAQRFTAAIISAVAVNPALQECEPGTILSAAFLGESLNLTPSPQLGQYYLVPFNDTKNKRKVATFILGYKGYIQLAIRSGQYKNIDVLAIKEGELLKYNPLTGEIDVALIEDDIKREVTRTIGYFATFELINGFRKNIYWSRDKMEQHALRYSKGYAAKKGYTFWEKDFDSMAFKTMLRQLISKWGVMSIELRDALEADDHTISNDLSPEFMDDRENDGLPPTTEFDDIAAAENDAEGGEAEYDDTISLDELDTMEMYCNG